VTVFRFRLATVLRQRRHLRDRRALELAHAAASATAAAAALGARERALAASREALGAAGRRGVPGADLAGLGQVVEHAGRLVGTARARLETAVAETDAARRQLVGADRDLRAVTRLHELALEAHRRELDRREAKRLDEVASIQHWRRPSPPGAGSSPEGLA
jgi:flagellar export protein FliJ